MARNETEDARVEALRRRWRAKHGVPRDWNDFAHELVEIGLIEHVDGAREVCSYARKNRRIFEEALQ